MKRLLRGSFGFLAVVLCLLVAGALIPGPTVEVPAAPTDREVWLLRGPIHTDFVLPLDPATRAAFAFADLPQESQWVIVGWGSRAFYTTTGSYRDLSLPIVWRAATGDDGVLRVLPVPEGAQGPGNWAQQRLEVGSNAYGRLLEAMTRRVIAGKLEGLSLSPGDAFYATDGRFSLLRSCNQWAGEVLRAAGLRTGIFTPTTGGLRVSLWWFGHADL
ncbi:MAG: DUF2459 domain-containing protein [Pseudomonadota bacterium]